MSRTIHVTHSSSRLARLVVLLTGGLCILAGCGAEPDAQECADSFPPYRKERVTPDVPDCVASPTALIGAAESEVRACAGAPCFDATLLSDTHMVSKWALYCGGEICSNDCAVSSRVYFENGRVSYIRRRPPVP